MFDSPKITLIDHFCRVMRAKKEVDLVVLRVVSLGVLLKVKEIWSFPSRIFQMENMSNQKIAAKNGQIFCRDFSPSKGHGVCSLHFSGGNKHKDFPNKK